MKSQHLSIYINLSSISSCQPPHGIKPCWIPSPFPPCRPVSRSIFRCMCSNISLRPNFAGSPVGRHMWKDLTLEFCVYYILIYFVCSCKELALVLSVRYLSLMFYCFKCQTWNWLGICYLSEVAANSNNIYISPAVSWFIYHLVSVNCQFRPLILNPNHGYKVLPKYSRRSLILRTASKH